MKCRIFVLVIGIAVLLSMTACAGIGEQYPDARDKSAKPEARMPLGADGDGRTIETKAGLFVLVRSGNVEALARAFEAGGVDVNVTEKDGTTLLQAAINSRQLEATVFLVNHGADVNMPGMGGYSPVMSAADMGLAELIPLLALRGAEMNHRSLSQSQSALYFAAFHGHAAVARALVDHGADPNLPDATDVVPLSYAVRYRHKEVAAVLLEHGSRIDPASVLIVRGVLDSSLLEKAAAQPDWSEVVAALLDRGAKCDEVRDKHMAIDAAADIDIVHVLQRCMKHSTGQVPPLDKALINAVRNGNARLAGELVDAGADVNGRAQGQVPLIEAMWLPNALEVTDMLIGKGADPNHLSQQRDAVLHRIASYYRADMAPLLDYLIKHGADVNLHAGLNGQPYGGTLGPVGDMPLHRAVYGGHRECVETLLANGAQLNLRGENDMTPLAAAFYRGRLDIATLLLDRGADIDAKGQGMNSPLNVAVVNGQTLSVQFALQHGADANYRETINSQPNRNYPLRDAAQEGRPGIVKLLLDYGADPGLGDHDRMESPVVTAIESGKTEVLRAFFDKRPELVQEFDLRKLAKKAKDEETRAYLLTKAGMKPVHIPAEQAYSQFLEETKHWQGERALIALRYPLPAIKVLLQAAQVETSLHYWATDSGRAYLLLAASFAGRGDIVRYFLGQGVPPDVTLEDARVPEELHNEELQEYWQEMTVSNGLLATPLLLANHSNSEDSVSALLAHGANPNRSFGKGYDISVLSASLEHLSDPSILKLLLEHGALPTTLNYAQFASLILGQRQEEIRMLLDFGLDRADVALGDGAALNKAQLSIKNPDALAMLLRSNPAEWKANCHGMPLSELTANCLPGELRDADAAVQAGYVHALEKTGDKIRARLSQLQSIWAKTLQKNCHVQPRTYVPYGWYAAVLDNRQAAICVVGMMRQRENYLQMF